MREREMIFQKQQPYNLIWLMILFLLSILGIIICFYKIPTYYHTTGIYKEEDKNVSVLLESFKLSKLYDSKVIINFKSIENQKLEISEFIVSEGKIYNQIIIEVEEPLDDVDGIVNVSFESPKKTILEKIWKGMMQ